VHKSGTQRLMSLVTSVCVLTLLCFAATPSAKASTTYNIVLTPTLGTDAELGHLL
jgi:hypothetical protein